MLFHDRKSRQCFRVQQCIWLCTCSCRKSYSSLAAGGTIVVTSGEVHPPHSLSQVVLWPGCVRQGVSQNIAKTLPCAQMYWNTVAPVLLFLILWSTCSAKVDCKELRKTHQHICKGMSAVCGVVYSVWGASLEEWKYWSGSKCLESTLHRTWQVIEWLYSGPGTAQI